MEKYLVKTVNNIEADASGNVNINSQTPWTSNINAAGYTLFGNSISGGTLTLSSTSHATKGDIRFGTSAYDEVNNRLGIGTTLPVKQLHIVSGTQVAASTDAQYVVQNDNGQYVAEYISTRSDYIGFMIRSTNGLASTFTQYLNNGTGKAWTQLMSPAGNLNILKGSAVGTNVITFGDNLNVGIGVITSPTARLHLPTGTAVANTAPLKLTSGTNLTTPEDGAFEFDGTSLFFTRSGTLRADILMTDIATPFNTYSASLKGATAFTTGNNNILLGNSAGSAMTTGVDNILIGRSTSTGTGGSQNIAIGTATTAGGNYNVSIGALAGGNSINATNAVSIGNSANYYSFNPNNGIAIGASAESGLGDNVSIGALAVSAYQGTNNVTVGGSAGRYAASGAGNTLIGNRTGTSLTTGAYNVALGFQSGNAITTGSKNIAIGYDVDPQSNTANGQLTIQNAIFGTDNIGVGTTVSTGNIGIYVVSPLARLHLPAGTAVANTAPLKLTTGTNLTTPEDGAFEFDGTNLYFTVGGVRKTVTLV